MPIALQLRPFQQEVKDDPARHHVVVEHRRAGKTVGACDWLVEPALDLDFPHKLPGYRGYYVCPLATQARDIALVYLEAMAIEGAKRAKEAGKHCTFDIVGRNGSPKIIWSHGAEIQLLGTEYGADRLRGRVADRIVLDEAAHIAQSAWTDVLRPMLSDRKGAVMAMGTPAGKLNLLHNLKVVAEKPGNDWSYHELKASTSGILPDEELRELRQEMGDRSYQREYECSFDHGAPGAFFEVEMGRLTDEGAIRPYRIDSEGEIHTAWHFGPSSISVQQATLQGGRTVFFNAERWEQTPLSEIIEELKSRNLRLGRHYAGGNIKKDDMRIRIAAEHGVRLILAPSLSMSDATQLTKARMVNVGFEPGDGAEAMRTVHALYDELKGTFSEKAVEDIAFEIASPVMHYYAAHNASRSDWSQPIQYGKKSTERRSRAGRAA